jgi:hypothetical protein
LDGVHRNRQQRSRGTKRDPATVHHGQRQQQSCAIDYNNIATCGEVELGLYRDTRSQRRARAVHVVGLSEQPACRINPGCGHRHDLRCAHRMGNIHHSGASDRLGGRYNIECRDPLDSLLSGFAQKVNFSGGRTPRLAQAGWLREAQTGRSTKFQNKFFVELSRPISQLLRPIGLALRARPLLSRRLRSISLVASTPPEPGGELARLLTSS